MVRSLAHLQVLRAQDLAGARPWASPAHEASPSFGRPRVAANLTTSMVSLLEDRAMRLDAILLAEDLPST